MMIALRLAGIAAVIASAAVYLRMPGADYGAGLLVHGVALVMLIGPLRILRILAGLALLFLAFG